MGIRDDLGSGEFSNPDDECYAEVGGNVQIIVCAALDPVNTFYSLFVDDVPESVRGGALLVSAFEEVIYNLTDDLRSGVTEFALNFAGE